jgi:hypothetical protein
VLGFQHDILPSCNLNEDQIRIASSLEKKEERNRILGFGNTKIGNGFIFFLSRTIDTCQESHGKTFLRNLIKEIGWQNSADSARIIL